MEREYQHQRVHSWYFTKTSPCPTRLDSYLYTASTPIYNISYISQLPSLSLYISLTAKMMLARRDASPAAAAGSGTKAEDSLSSGDTELNVMASIWKSKNKKANKKRFTDEQIRLLETMFEAESRPELQIKHKLANELGLHPRQVAIWFQNKRARSKSKLIEQEYSILKRSYDNLASKFDSLKNENQRLLVQVQTVLIQYNVVDQHTFRPLQNVFLLINSCRN